MEQARTVDFGRIAGELALQASQVESVVALLDEGNTIPFITRYRKEQTGNLDEEQILAIGQRISLQRQLAERASAIMRLIEAQGKLTPVLRSRIEQAETLKRLEDLYLPYRPKRRSRATAARERGLEPLAESIWSQDPSLASLESAAAAFVAADKDLPTTDDVLRGAADIIAEKINESAQVRESARRVAARTGTLTVSETKTAAESGQAFRDYFDYSEAVAKIPPHRALAINRGEKESVLRVKFGWDADAALASVTRELDLESHRHVKFVKSCAADALQRLIQPSLERELRRESTERAEAHAVSVFAKNLKNLLLQPPLRGKRVLAVDPGFRTGCKIAALDECGHRLAADVVYVTGSAEKRKTSIAKLVEFARVHGCELVAIGNGTACRETEELISEMIAGHLPELRYVIVNEAGASIYSTSSVAREEFPEFDATERGTVSIGRRVQDPLSELVKIDPQHIGVGMYQHDVSAKLLKESLDQVVQSCVNYVGVDLNTASASLLRYVSGLNQMIARRVVAWRDEHGRFNNRRELLNVAGVGDATFTQAAGFLRVQDGDEPLDRTWIHPESYDLAHKILARIELSDDDLQADGASLSTVRARVEQLDVPGLSEELQLGLPTLRDITDALSRPGRDPRADQAGPVFKQGVLNLNDLHEEMELTGTVLNVVDFGAFVDIGLKDSGLVHVSQLAARFVKNPLDVVAVGDVVTVWVTSIDKERRRISLTMIRPGTPPAERRPEKPQQRKHKSPGARKKKPSAEKPRKSPPPKREEQRPELTNEKREGTSPLTGFDELKELWRDKD